MWRWAVARLAKPRVVAFFDARYSIINGRFCIINGLKLGLEWKNRLRTGAAVYFLSSRIPTRRPTTWTTTPAPTCASAT